MLISILGNGITFLSVTSEDAERVMVSDALKSLRKAQKKKPTQTKVKSPELKGAFKAAMREIDSLIGEVGQVSIPSDPVFTSSLKPFRTSMFGPHVEQTLE